METFIRREGIGFTINTPHEVDAIRFDGSNGDAIMRAVGCGAIGNLVDKPSVLTAKGIVQVVPGDYVMKTKSGMVLVRSGEVFTGQYERKLTLAQKFDGETMRTFAHAAQEHEARTFYNVNNGERAAAMQFTGDNCLDVLKFAGSGKLLLPESERPKQNDTPVVKVVIDGTVTMNKGDWITHRDRIGFDVVPDKLFPTTYARWDDLRPEVKAITDRMLTQVCTVVVLWRHRVLMLQRGPQTSFAEHWCFPGGKLEPGETLEACILRELMEETGIKAQKLRYIGSETFVSRKMEVHTFGCSAPDDMMPQVTLEKGFCGYGWFTWYDAWDLEHMPSFTRRMLDAQGAIEAECEKAPLRVE